jgi:branched-chain amino acid transport system permease protein
MSAVSPTAVPGGTRVRRATTTSAVFAVVAFAAVVVLVSLPSWAERSTLLKMIELLVLIAVAQMWNLLAGFAGVVSVGQQAFVGLGAYGLIVCHNNLGLGLYPSVFVSALAAAVISIPMGLVAFRLRGSYFAIGTWVLAEVAMLVMLNNSSVGGGSGVSLKVTGYKVASRVQNTYLLALLVGVGSVVVCYLVLRSRLGLQMQAIRDNEAGARSLGANVYRTRFVIWVLGALWTAMAGAVFYMSALRVQPETTFSVVQWAAPIIFIVVIGGIGTIEGPLIGAILYYVFRDRFIDDVTWYSISLGAIAMIAALRFQKGIWGLLRRRVDVQLFPLRRRVDLDR